MSIPDTLPNPAAGPVLSGRWRLDPKRSSVEFRAKKIWGLVTVRGHFDRYQGRLDLDADPAIELTIEAATVHTGIRKRDTHLRSGDFFDVAHHPLVRFHAGTADLVGDRLITRGDLHARGGQVPLTVEATLRPVDDEWQIEAAAGVDHRELGMTYSPLGMIPRRSVLFVKGRLTRADRRDPCPPTRPDMSRSVEIQAGPNGRGVSSTVRSDDAPRRDHVHERRHQDDLTET